MAYKQSPFNFYDGEGDPKKKAARKANKAQKKADKKFLDDQHEEPVKRRHLDKEGKKIYDSHKKNRKAEEKAHNKHARKTEGSLVRQSLRRRFGSNKPK
tara:strand:+ start:270 stop:566 length:297 start_codon:yes stop_codon:yes gene_type:complete